jgi:hypothetical protein
LDEHDAFWAQDEFLGDGNREFANAVYDEGAGTVIGEASIQYEAICVTEPSA